jgi:hypothetical protein
MAAHRLCQDFENKTIEFKDNEEYKWKNKQINVIHKTFIQDNHHTKLKCTISTPNSALLKPGSLVITKRNTIEYGVYLGETLTKVLRQNKIFVVITNNNPYPVFIKKTPNALRKQSTHLK